MRKQELVQLHALCVVVRDHLEDRHDVDTALFDRYEDHGVSPTSIHRRKGRHKEALFRLLDGLGDASEQFSHRTEPTAASSQ